jgi:maltooligosyltrehalose trehalohydrolase
VTRFRVWAPHASAVDLVMDGERRRLTPEIYGFHEVDAEAGAGARYGFSLDWSDPLPDPRSRYQPDGVHGLSAIPPDPLPVDRSWRGRDLRSSVLYELHVGTFTPEGTFDGVIAKLDHLVALGVDAIELMPIAEFPGARGWGYDGVDLYAAHRAYGGPEGLARLLRACHERGLAVVLDVVYNHLGPDGNHLERFGPYFTHRHHTPWGRAMNYDGPDSGPVRDLVVENTLHWLRFGLDGVRLDAVHAIVDLSATHVVEQLTRRVDELEAELGRTLWVIAESDLNDPRVVRARDDWGWGCDAQWSDDLHHALHTVLTGERAGYYGDFGRMADLAKAMRDVFVYDGRPSDFRRRVHGRPVGDLPATRFLAYSQTHDQVGNRAGGERLAHLVSDARLRIAAAVVLLSPFVPMLFMGEEWAARSPFLYFTDHQDERLARAVSDGRQRELERFGWPPGAYVDPQSREAFARSTLDWSEQGREPHRSMLDWYRALLTLRRTLPELHEGPRELTQVELSDDPRWLVMRRGRLTVAFALEREADIPLVDRAGELVLASAPGVTVSSSSLRIPAECVAVLRS